MSGWTGALRGASRALQILIAATLLPGLAALVGWAAHALLGIGFGWGFLAGLVVLTFVGASAAVGAAAGIEDTHAAAVDAGDADPS